jgi:hypothetical protein
VSLRRSISGNSGKPKFLEVQFLEILVCVLIHPLSRNHPDDNSDSQVSFDEMLELFIQLRVGIYIGKKDYKKKFWTTESFLRPLACPRLCCRQLQGTALCACGAPPLLHVPGGGDCVSGAGSSTLCRVPRTLSASCASRGCAHRYPSVGYNATYDYLEGQLDDAERAKRMLPAKKQQRCGLSATSAPSSPAVPSPAAAEGPRTTPRAARADDTEDDDEPIFATPGFKKRGRNAR